MVAHVDGMPTDTPSHSQIVAAMQSLARVHAALAATPEEPPRGVDSRGLTERITRARLLLEHPWRKLLNSELPATRAAESLVADLRRACGLFEAHDGEGMLKWLAAFVPAPLPCQVVLRDIWSDHVLFDHRQPDRIAGIVDLHAMGIDSPATDIGRLLGSWLPIGGAVDARWWDAAMDAYETVRPLGDRERRLVPFLAATGIVFGLDNWFRWTLEENRTFPDPTRVVSRIDRLVKSLSAALIVLNATESHAGLTLENSRP
jgi:Ser/Thr protein kinase RdoA (MazF antagonist)